MPANYAHHRFGRELLETMPPQVRRTVQRFRMMYDVGLHGPDIFFYYNPFFRNPVRDLGHELHMRSGEAFFTQVCQNLRKEAPEAAMAYLYGLLAHYCLDSVCHPFVHECSDDGKIGHTEMEVEFDRYLMVLDGIASPHTYDLSPVFRLTRGECVTVSDFYPNVTPAQISGSVVSSRVFIKLLAFRNRRFLKAVLSPLGESVRQQWMHNPANHACLHLNDPMLALYRQALDSYPRLLEQLLAHLNSDEPLGQDFAPIFG